MNCPNCSTPNPPEAVYCQSCNVLLPTHKTLRRLKAAAVFKALMITVAVVALYLVTSFAVSMVWSLKFSLSAPPGITDAEFNEAFYAAVDYLNIIYAGIALLIAAVFFGLRRRSITDAANIRPVPPLKAGAAFVAGLTAQIPIGVILSFIPFPETVVEGHNELMTASASPMWAQLLYAVIMAPVIEEIFFRGIAHDRLAKTMPVPVAAAISSFAFAVIHGELIAILVAFVCGFLFAMLYSRFGSVLVTIPFHMGFNLLSFAVAYITDPILMLAAAIASFALLIGSLYLLFRKDKPENTNITNGDIQ